MDDICVLHHTMERCVADMVIVLESAVDAGVDRATLHKRVDKHRIEASTKSWDEIKEVLDDNDLTADIDAMREGKIKETSERYLNALAILAGHFFVFRLMVAEEHDKHHGIQVSEGSVSPSTN